MKPLLNLSPEDLKHDQIIDWGYTESTSPLTFVHYEDWVEKKLHGPLGYLADERREKRKSYNHYFPDYQSALVFLFDYTGSVKRNIEEDDFRFAGYTQAFDGMDYHYWIKDKLEKITAYLQFENIKYSIDAQPVLERDLAYSAGLGWFGKNSMLINRKHGSTFLIAAILLSEKIDLPTQKIEIDHCGNCTACIAACPTDAIIEDKIIDASKCISTFTIEMFKETLPPKGFPTNSGEIFGCDICQTVCPWNRNPLKLAEIIQKPEWLENFDPDDLNNISNREFKRVYKGTSLERTGRVGLLKNLKR